MIKYKNKLIVVGAFPPSSSCISGGVVASSKIFYNPQLTDHYDLIYIDSTQISNPPPSIFCRLLLAFKRFVYFCFVYLTVRPDAVLIFASAGFSLMEKCFMSKLARVRSIPVLLFPRAGRVIESFHSSRICQLLINAGLRTPTHFLCQGPSWQRFAIENLGFDQIKAPIIYNWTATNELLRIGSSRSFPSISRVPCLLFLGWMIREKGIFDLLQVCLILTRYHNFRLIFAGGGRDEDQAKSFVKFHRLDNVIEFKGWVYGDHKNELLKSADILVLPSWQEGFPNCVIEAMAAKLSVIVTSVGSVPELIQDRQQALVIPPKDLRSLERAIDFLIVNPHFSVELAERGYSFARENFSTNHGVFRLIEVIDSAISDTSRPKY